MAEESYISYFTPGQMSRDTLEFIFVKRQKLADRIEAQLAKSILTPSKQHTLLIGPRGIGKSHLIALIYHRVKSRDDLRDKVALAWFAEEEWGVASLADFFFIVLRALANEYPDSGLESAMASMRRLPRREINDAAGKAIRDFVGERTLLLLVENLEEIFKGLNRDEQWALRSYLSEQPFATILATTPSLFTGVQKQTEAFYGFFQATYLDELTADEATELLEKLAKRRGDEKLATYLTTSVAKERVQAVNDLAGGHPRVYLLFAHLLTQERLDELVTPFLELLDELTPYYQSRMQLLSPQQRKIVEFMCDSRGAALQVKVIAEETLLEPRATAAQLGELEKIGYVRKTPVGRESYYELREPLLRMVIELKRSHNQEPLRLVVDFLRRWYSRAERRAKLKSIAENAPLTRLYLEHSLDLDRAIRDRPDIDRAKVLSPQFLKYYSGGDFERATEIAEEIIERKTSASTSADWFQLGCCLNATAQYEEALTSYERAIELDPNNTFAHFNCGGVLYRLGRYEEALTCCDRVIKIDKDQMIVRFNRGVVLTKLGRDEEAMASFDEFIGLDPDNADAYFGRGNALNNLGRYEEALASFDKAVALDSDDVRGYVGRGNALFNLYRVEEALASFDRAFALDPDNAIANFNRGNVLARLGRYEEALTDLDRIIALHPGDRDGYASRGSVLSRLGRYEEALASFDRAIALDPDNAIAYFNRGNALSRLGRYEEALASFDRAIALDPDDPDCHVVRSSVLSRLGRYEEALASFDRAIALDPDNAIAYFNRGNALSRLGRYEEALASFDRAIALDPDDPDCHTGRGDTLYDLGRNEESLASFDRAVALDSSDPDGYINRGNALSRLGRYEEALASFDRAIALDPDNAIANFNRGNALYDLGQDEEALASYDRAIALDPSGRDSYVNKGNVLDNLGRYEEALVICDKAIELDPDEAKGYIGRGNALSKLNRYEEALASYARAIALEPDNAIGYFNSGNALYDLGQTRRHWRVMTRL
jgi:tetratricopeptide (TPR) repeat protein